MAVNSVQCLGLQMDVPVIVITDMFIREYHKW
jgi:hypothetical protein